MSYRDIEGYIQELELFYSIFTATKDTLGKAQEERPNNVAKIQHLIEKLSESRNYIQDIIYRINGFNIPGVYMPDFNYNLSLSETPTAALLPTSYDYIDRIKAILHRNAAAALRPDNAAAVFRPDNAAAAFRPDNAAVAFRPDNAVAVFRPDNVAAFRPKNVNQVVAAAAAVAPAADDDNFGYGNLTEEEQIKRFRQMEEWEAVINALSVADRARLQQYRDPHYNKYLKYKNKYLSLKNNIFR
jgi:hypothetical protein